MVMIDEIQFMTKYIFYDKERKVRARRLPGAYHGLVESKTAPMLVAGSYIGWMSRMMFDMFKGGRLRRTPISPRLAFAEGMECVYKYSEYNDIPVSEDSALAICLYQTNPSLSFTRTAQRMHPRRNQQPSQRRPERSRA